MFYCLKLPSLLFCQPYDVTVKRMAPLEGKSWGVWSEIAAIPPGMNISSTLYVYLVVTPNGHSWFTHLPPHPQPHQSPSPFHPNHSLAPLALQSTNKASCFIFSLLKYFCGYRLSTKIFYSKFFYNEINSNENFPDYSSSEKIKNIILLCKQNLLLSIFAH